MKEGAAAPGWTAHEALLCRAADDLHGGGRVSDDTWRALAERYDEKQLLDVVFTVGQYNLVSWALNSIGVELDEGVPRRIFDQVAAGAIGALRAALQRDVELGALRRLDRDHELVGRRAAVAEGLEPAFGGRSEHHLVGRGRRPASSPAAPACAA